MKASELRIGNYVMDRGNKVLLIDHWEYKDKISEKRIDGYHPFTEYVEHLQPIPLTEEWLFKFGFEIGYNKTKMLDVYCKDFGFLIERSNGGNFYYKKVYVQHVHQLQNLYFALSGEELTFKSE